ncbi:MAG: MotA/TolQ/ExbB proton channel family protein [Pirellulales bacterium]|jgi:biopolymer transport protein ExbB|nr:MotA/TolQ/ExbB proton channel family protein [Pirellulales bacterium]
MRMIIPLLNLKRTLWCLMLGLSVGIACVAAPALVSVTWAQEDADVVDDDAEVNPPAAAPRPAETAPASTSNEKRSYLAWAFKSLGWFYSVVFLLLSFSLVALFVMNLLTARRENIVPTQLIEGFEEHLNNKQYQEAYELAKNDDSFLGQVLSAGLAKLSAGYSPAIEAMQEVGEEETMKLEHKLSYMALIGTISPMIGLLGTVQGMIASFNVIAFATTAPKPKDLAEGIATALFTTLVGLSVAIPAIAANNILRNRIARLVLEVGIVSEGLMSRFQNMGTKKKDLE